MICLKICFKTVLRLKLICGTSYGMHDDSLLNSEDLCIIGKGEKKEKKSLDVDTQQTLQYIA